MLYTVAGKNGQMTTLRYARCKARRNVLPALSGLPDQGAPYLQKKMPVFGGQLWLIWQPLEGLYSKEKFA